MFDIKDALGDQQIFFCRQTLCFYMAFSAGLGVDDIRELPTLVNMELHHKIDISSLSTWTLNAYCIGRYRDDNESDEAVFECDGYYVELTRVGLEHYQNSSIHSVAPSFVRLNKALVLASRAHKNQYRKYDDSPYINHLLEVQNLLVNTANVTDEDVIIGGLLHDIIEDADVDKLHLIAEFGSRVSNLVNYLTDDKEKSLEERRSAKLAKIQNAPKSVKLIKLAHITTNAAAIPESWSQIQVQKYCQWIDSVADSCKDVNEALYNTYLNSKVR